MRAGRFLSILLLAAVVRADAAASRPPELPRHSETIVVREGSVLVEMPEPSLLDKLRRNRRPSDFQLLVDDTVHEVVSAGPAAGPGGWEIVVYLDAALAPADPLRDAVLLVAKRMERLTALGSVEVVVADPEPRLALASLRDLAGWPAALAQVVVEAGGRAPGMAEPRLLETVRRQCDRLVAFATARRSTRPRALLWIGAPDLPVSPSENNALTYATDPELGREAGAPQSLPIAGAFAAASRALAAAGWVVFPVLARPPALPPPPPPPPGSAALERPRYSPTLEGKGGPFSGFPQDPKEKARRASGNLKLDAALLPWLAPHHLLAKATAGRVVQDEIQLDDALDSLGRRWRLWYRPALPVDSRVHRLEVALNEKASVAGTVGLDKEHLLPQVRLKGDRRLSGRHLPAPVWVQGWEAAPENVP